MDTMNKLFFKTKPTWKRVILFAAATAVLTALMMILPFTADTSFRQIGVTFECWILFALLIILNCETPLEAGLKTFVFFLISQPLIYLLEVPFSWQGWGLFQYYGRWFVWTVLCFPGAILAWFTKKDKWYSALILSAATGFLAYSAVDYAKSCLRRPPHYLIAAIFCAVLAVFLIFLILKSQKNRIIAGAVTLAVAAGLVILPMLSGAGTGASMTYDLPEGEWEIVKEEGSVGTVRISETDASVLIVEATKKGTAEVTLRNIATGEEIVMVVTYDGSFPDITEKLAE